MAYVESRTVHDADAHVMELPDTLVQYMEARYIDAFREKASLISERGVDADSLRERLDDPAFRADEEEELLLRKGHLALGAFRREDRVKALDLLGFSSQLVFTTVALSNYGLDQGDDPGLAVAAARAHNRMNADFCSVDARLLATAYVPLVDMTAAVDVAKEAIALGCKGLVIPSVAPPGHSPSHVGLDPLWALAQEAGLPILTHVGGEEKMRRAYLNNGLPAVKDFHGGDENFTSLSFMSIPLSVWQTMSALIFDGVLDRFPALRFAAIELGASWVPSWLRFMDSGFDAFRKGEERLRKLSARPSEIAARQFRVTPYPHEPSGWIIDNAHEDMLMFSSDFPHVEGGRNPLKRFAQALSGQSAQVLDKFYKQNFIDLMGRGLDRALHDRPEASR
jgi:predicted TIM-barrel fold metal-dependent hydrolase